MYRIEIKPGEENVFRTIEELATAIRNGLVTPRARIFHNASQKWLPIEFHPHYKKALQLPKTTSGETPAIVVASASPKAHEPPKTHQSPKVHEAPKAQEPPRVQEPPPVQEPPTVQQPAKTRELTFIHAPTPVRAAPAPTPVVTQAPVPKSAPVAPPQPAPVAPPPVATKPAASVESFSPVIELPPIDYPETTSVESLIPVASASRARASHSRRRSLVLGTAAAVMIAGAYVGLSGAMPAHEAAADSGPISSIPVTAAEPAHQLAVAPLAKANSSISNPVVTAATSRSPSFGPPAVPPAAQRQIVASIGATPAPPKDSVATVEPPPVDVDISVPSLPTGDSLAPVTRTDSNAIGRILRAVGGKGGSTPKP